MSLSLHGRASRSLHERFVALRVLTPGQGWCHSVGILLRLVGGQSLNMCEQERARNRVLLAE